MVVLILVLADIGATILWFTVQVAEKKILTKLNNVSKDIQKDKIK